MVIDGSSSSSWGQWHNAQEWLGPCKKDRSLIQRTCLQTQPHTVTQWANSKKFHKNGFKTAVLVEKHHKKYHQKQRTSCEKNQWGPRSPNSQWEPMGVGGQDNIFKVLQNMPLNHKKTIKEPLENQRTCQKNVLNQHFINQSSYSFNNGQPRVKIFRCEANKGLYRRKERQIFL